MFSGTRTDLEPAANLPEVSLELPARVRVLVALFGNQPLLGMRKTPDRLARARVLFGKFGIASRARTAPHAAR